MVWTPAVWNSVGDGFPLFKFWYEAKKAWRQLQKLEESRCLTAFRFFSKASQHVAMISSENKASKKKTSIMDAVYEIVLGPEELNPKTTWNTRFSFIAAMTRTFIAEVLKSESCSSKHGIFFCFKFLTEFCKSWFNSQSKRGTFKHLWR